MDCFEILNWTSIALKPRVAIIGAGPAGRTAATVLDEAGIPHDVLDEQPRSGGNIERRLSGGVPAIFDRQAHSRFRCHSISLALRPGGLVRLHEAGRIRTERYDAVLATAGAYDLALPRPGLAGKHRVSTAGALRALLKGEGIVPTGQVVIAGAGPFLHVVAADLCAAGAQVT